MDRARRDGPDPYLDWKVRIFFAGGVLLLAGVLLDRRVLALLAAVVLGVGLILSLVIRLRERRRQDERIAYYAEHDDES